MDSKAGSPPRKARATAGSVWAVLGVILFLFNGVRRVVPAALQPFSRGLGAFGWASYVASVLFFAYAEGYRGFQQRFSPLVVRRALLLDGTQPVLRQVLAPAYAMAFFHAKCRRKVASWILICGIFFIVAVVKRLPYPYRAILDAGVVTGLSWGMCATGLLFVRSLRTGRAPDVDPCLPEEP
eukprot:TRINITY_DN112145_c0_g1_i1.p1 TRINITY_DN112145_c0_g1~~TRINITY_DN112145_c0_g1_i1.p1  ORF type:complete len:182 (+),score=21.12 TRINITY_DN112145_c0_g1_i1:38-583(+)